MNELIEFARLAVRVKSTAFDSELETLVDSCLMDLQLAGVDVISASDNLIRQAIALYCRAYFGSGFENPERYEQAYMALKITMANSSKYNGEGE